MDGSERSEYGTTDALETCVIGTYVIGSTWDLCSDLQYWGPVLFVVLGTHVIGSTGNQCDW